MPGAPPEDIGRNCPMVRTLDRIGGRWKPVILHLLRSGCRRFSDLGRTMPGVTRSVLARQLHELEADGLVVRTAHPGTPPRVDYALTPYGLTLGPVLDSLYAWGMDQPAATERGRRFARLR